MSIAAPLNPWEVQGWSNERIQIINRDMGLFLYSQKQQMDVADFYFSKAIDLLDDDWKTYYYRSLCKRNNALTSDALDDALTSENYVPRKNNLVDLQKCDCIYEMNEFEKANLLLHRNRKLCSGTKISAYDARLCITRENINDAIGNSLGPFIQKNGKIFPIVLEDLRRRNEVDPRPLWKILKSQGLCDVLSVLEKEEKKISPRERARRERAFQLFNETYLNKSWVDVFFLRSLRNDPNLLLKQTPRSTSKLHALVNNKYHTVYKFLKMLHARCPLYSMKSRFGNLLFCEKYLQEHLYRVQYETRRLMFSVLHNVNLLRKKHKITLLCKYIEKVMGQFIIKTSRVMPWKFEFINEVYNIVALAFTDRCVIPKNISSISPPFRKAYLYRLPQDRKEHVTAFVFGDKSTVQDTLAESAKAMIYRNQIIHYETRIENAEYIIEKCYLLHEIARIHLTHGRIDECVSVAKKAFEESKKCNSNIWTFLSQLLILKSHVQMHRVEREQDCLFVAQEIAVKLRSKQLFNFIHYLIVLNTYQIEMKRNQPVELVNLRSSQAIVPSTSFTTISKHGSQI